MYNGSRSCNDDTVFCALEQCGYITTLLHEDLEVLVNNGDSKKDTGARANCAHEVGHHSQCSDAHATKCSSNWDVATEDLLHFGFGGSPSKSSAGRTAACAHR